MEYSTDLFEAATIDQMLDHFVAMLGAAVADPEQCLEELPLMSDFEQEQVLRWGDQAEPLQQCESPDLERLSEQELDSLITLLDHETVKAR